MEKETMTLEQAAAHAREVAEKQDCPDLCRRDHSQLAEWLDELAKCRKENETLKAENKKLKETYRACEAENDKLHAEISRCVDLLNNNAKDYINGDTIDTVKLSQDIMCETAGKCKVTKFYKIMHKPTGLFFKAGVCNLSEQGKAYSHKPSLHYVGNPNYPNQPIFIRVGEHLKKRLNAMGWHVEPHRKEVTGDTGFHITTYLSDFEIKEYTQQI